MKFTQVPADTFRQIQLNAGVLLKEFDPSTGELDASKIVGATTGGISFTATPEFLDFGEDIDNVPNNTKELKKLDYYTATMSGSFVTVTPAAVKLTLGAADVDSTDGTKIVPRADLLESDFDEVWWVGDYSDKNGNRNGGFVAIQMLNTLSTSGFGITTGDKAKGTFSFEYTAHYSLNSQDVVPFNIYVKAGEDEPTDGGGSDDPDNP